MYLIVKVYTTNCILYEESCEYIKPIIMKNIGLEFLS